MRREELTHLVALLGILSSCLGVGTGRRQGAETD